MSCNNSLEHLAFAVEFLCSCRRKSIIIRQSQVAGSMQAGVIRFTCISSFFVISSCVGSVKDKVCENNCALFFANKTSFIGSAGVDCRCCCAGGSCRCCRCCRRCYAISGEQSPKHIMLPSLSLPSIISAYILLGWPIYRFS